MPNRHHARGALLAALAVAAAIALAVVPGAARSAAACSNVVVCENAKPGNPKSEWDVVGLGDPSIQGYATPFSVDNGELVNFKVKTDATAYRLDIYRLGYYNGNGARKVATVLPSAPLPQSQPPCMSDSTTGLVDCGTWGTSASWNVPTDAVSGVYLAKLVRTDTLGESHIVFVVRDDDRASELLFQTSDTTWQAYNRYGGNSLYFGSPASRAYKVSYNRPFTTRDHNNTSFLFNGEYPMIRFLERNGYDVSYFAGVDSARRGQEILEHKAFLSVGHDEYWSGEQRANVEQARDAGVNLAFFSGNEVFWKTRWEPSIDGQSTPFTTLVSYKETAAGQKIDPDPAWTGTWRDARFSPPSDGGRPENALTGTIFMVNSYREDSIKVPAKFAPLRFWRNTTVATSSGTTTLRAGTLGHEWDEDRDNGSRPAGLMQLSSTTISVPRYLQDEGNTYAQGSATHALTLYKAASGALVFGAGTVQWAWGLDNVHDVFSSNPPRAVDVRIQQATVNLLADMRVQPQALQSGLVATSASTDTTAPTAAITAPASGSSASSGTKVTISGTAADTGGQVAGVEISTDGGSTWHPAVGTQSWTYSWTVAGAGEARLLSRAVDDSGNLGPSSAAVLVNVSCPCRLWPPNTVPATLATTDAASVEVGIKFSSDVSGWISAIRFYKGTGNAGTHVGSLWTTSGDLLARATFTGETATGWQEVQLDQPVQVTAGTTYVASYFAPTGRYSLNLSAFSSQFVSPPLRAPSSGSSGGNGVFRYSSIPAFPTQSYSGSNYWVDVVFHNQTPVDTKRPTVVATNPLRDATNADPGGSIEATMSEALDAASVTTTTATLRTSAGVLVPASVSWNGTARRIILTPNTSLAYDALYTARISGGSAGVRDRAGNTLGSTYSWSFRTARLRDCPCSIWDASTVPAVPATGDQQSTELGVKFHADQNGWISGIRFYKGAGNSGTHVGSLWSRTGTLLARATFISETATGWQEALFDGPVAVTAGTTYVASYYAPQGRYALNFNAFTTAGAANPPLRALQDSVDGGNGVYRYAAAPSFPTDSYGASNYWVDVVYATTFPGDTVAPRVVTKAPADGATGVDVLPDVVATFSEPLAAASVNASTFELLAPGGAVVPASVSYDSSTLAATLRPQSPLAMGGTYTARLRGTDGVRDVAGNGLAGDVSWTFIVRSCPCSIFSSGELPATASSSDPGPVELGVLFRADRAGSITGVRFYKGVGNTGQHVGSLWRADGTLLARATFSGESASGWQQAVFDEPVAIDPQTTYVASYFAPNGGYSVTFGDFNGTGAGGTPVRALRDGEDGPNGVYRYGSGPGFPSDSFGSSNYWVDVLFAPS
jgi:Domain of unknown function (DUF4082)/Bacterial Ig-like domain/Bacterial Ig domain